MFIPFEKKKKEFECKDGMGKKRKCTWIADLTFEIVEFSGIKVNVLRRLLSPLPGQGV